MSLPGDPRRGGLSPSPRSEEHTSELQSHVNLVCRLLLEKKKKQSDSSPTTTTQPCTVSGRRHYGICETTRYVFSASCIEISAKGSVLSFVLFFFNDTATTEIYTLSLHDALPISRDDDVSGLDLFRPRRIDGFERV